MGYFSPATVLGSTVEISEIETLAKGTLIVGDGSGAPSTLAVGSNSTLLVAASGEATGVQWSSTLSGLTLTSPVLTTPQINDTSADHQYIFAVSELAADRTVTLPLLTGNDTFVFNDFAATLTNKTLTSPVLTTPQINDTSADHQYVFAVSELAADRTVTLPLLTGNDTFVFNDFAATLTNKTLTSPVLTTPQINDTSSDHQYIFAVNELAADRTVTLPLLTGNDTFVFNDFAATLTNKTLTSPVLTTPQINDTSADHQYIFAVNELTADRTVTLPLLTGNDTFVFNDFAATLTNKTIAGASNTLTVLAATQLSGAVPLANGGTGAVLADPGADRIMFWDDSETATAYLTLGNGLTITTTSIAVDTASDTVDGVVELATAAETTTGTDTGRAVTPDGLAGSSIFGVKGAQVVAFDFTTDTATGDGKAYFRVPPSLNGMNLIGVAARVITAGTTNTLDIQINNVTQAADMLTTKITIDSTETDSSTAATAAVIDTANDDVATGDLLRIDVDAVHTTAAKGLIVSMEFQLP